MAAELANPQTDRASLNAEGRAFEITKSASFEAAHFLSGHGEGHPYGNVHGHSFRVEATVAGIVPPGEEWVADFAYVEAALKETAARLDHKLLNEIEGLGKPTLERLCLWIAEDLKPKLPGLAAITVARPSLNERCTLKLG